MPKIITREQWELRVNDSGTGRYEFIRWSVAGEYGSQKNCVVRCIKDGHEWSAIVNNLVNIGTGCPQCARQIILTADERIEQINSLENIEFVSWVDGYRNVSSKANVRCLVDNFVWSPEVNSLVNKGCGCPHCSGKRRWTADDRIDHINKLENIEFVSWFDGYKSKDSKANVRCKIDNFEWSAEVGSLINQGTGCPQCSGVRKWTAEERVEQINSLENISFISWVDGHNGKDSKANIRCQVDNYVWSASVNNLISQGSGCPRCAKYGYQLDKKGYLYALHSECGRYLKVGISNNPSIRHKQLEKRTPFKFNLVEQISGDGAKIAAMERHFHSKYESAGFKSFDGATEWLVCTPQLLEELRTIGDK